MPFFNARLWTGTLPNQETSEVRFKIYLTGDVAVGGLKRHSWSQIYRRAGMLAVVKPQATFANRNDAVRNALEVFSSKAEFLDYARSPESKNGLEMSDSTRIRLNLEELDWK